MEENEYVDMRSSFVMLFPPLALSSLNEFLQVTSLNCIPLHVCNPRISKHSRNTCTRKYISTRIAQVAFYVP